jgi:hypothetical protein
MTIKIKYIIVIMNMSKCIMNMKEVYLIMYKIHIHYYYMPNHILLNKNMNLVLNYLIKLIKIIRLRYCMKGNVYYLKLHTCMIIKR